MSESVYHVKKISLGLKRKYLLSADDGSGRPGESLGYAEKQLTIADRLEIFQDRSRQVRVATVQESKDGLVAALVGYDVVDEAGVRMGSFRSVPSKSIDRTTWDFEQTGLGRLRGRERSGRTAAGRRAVGLVSGFAGQFVNALAKYHFDFERDGELMFSIEKPKVFDDWYRLTVRSDRLEPMLLFGLVMTMEFRVRG